MQIAGGLSSLPGLSALGHAVVLEHKKGIGLYSRKQKKVAGPALGGLERKGTATQVFALLQVIPQSQICEPRLVLFLFIM